MSQTPDLDALLANARNGDQAALIALLESVGPTVRQRISAKISGPIRTVLDEDDVMQVTYMEAVTRLDRFSGGGAAGFLSWLTRLAENNLIDAIRAMESSKRPDPHKRVHEKRTADETSTALMDILGMTHTTPSVVAARGESANLLDVALGQLPADYEAVVRLYDLAGKSAQEIAGQLGRSEGAIYMLRARAHDRLKEILGSGSRFFSTDGQS